MSSDISTLLAPSEREQDMHSINNKELLYKGLLSVLSPK